MHWGRVQRACLGHSRTEHTLPLGRERSRRRRGSIASSSLCHPRTCQRAMEQLEVKLPREELVQSQSHPRASEYRRLNLRQRRLCLLAPGGKWYMCCAGGFREFQWLEQCGSSLWSWGQGGRASALEGLMPSNLLVGQRAMDQKVLHCRRCHYRWRLHHQHARKRSAAGFWLTEGAEP